MLWDKQHDETLEEHTAFLTYLESNPRPSNAVLGKKFNIDATTIHTWKNKHKWIERADAYDRWVEESTIDKRETVLKENAHKLQIELYNNIKRLLIENNSYLEKLTKGGIEELANLDVHELRDNANENLELIGKLIKPYKEILLMTPEGKKLLEAEKETGDQVIIHVHPNEPEPKIVHSVPNKEIEHKEADVEDTRKPDDD
jgi:hypothetical protein